MTPQRAKELLPVIKAYSEKIPIQVRLKRGINGNPGEWRDYRPSDPAEFSELRNVDFDNDDWEWRVKPEPKEFWITKYSIRPGVAADAYAHKPRDYSDNGLIHVVEVVNPTQGSP